MIYALLKIMVSSGNLMNGNNPSIMSNPGVKYFRINDFLVGDLDPMIKVIKYNPLSRRIPSPSIPHMKILS